jgi:hypothetical protein
VELDGAAAVNVTLNLNPEVEKGLMARAHARGLSLDDYLQELVAKEAGLPVAAAEPPHRRTGQVCAKVRGLLTDEEVDTLFSRTHSFSRPVDFE